MKIIEILATELSIKESQVKASIELIDEGNTIPFIARYRKEQTGSLDDEVLRKLDERLKYLRNLEDKKNQVLGSISEQGKLSDELKIAIENAKTLVEIDDLYRPYRPKKRTRAMIAKEKGLEALALEILNAKEEIDLKERAKRFLSEDVEKEEDALAGASDIIAELVSDEAKYRFYIREKLFETAFLDVSAKDENETSVYENYYAYEEKVKDIPSHRVLAINRGENEKFLSVKLKYDEESILEYLFRNFISVEFKEYVEFLKTSITDAYKRLIFPSIEREIRNEITQRSEESAIGVFAKNLEQLLLQAPIKNKVVLGWDPAFRTGCKLSVVDDTGKVLDTKVIYPTKPQEKVEESISILSQMIKKYNVDLIALGNGTASRESEKVIVELINKIDRKLAYVIVNEAGASVYSASELATKEFPNFDVGQRSATSIARRLQDPLAELVKIEPRSIGVGQYQHDMNQKRLSEVLGAVVEDSVNKVGVDLNTASASLLSYISGINKTLAQNIISYREEMGAFKNRKDLLKVPKLGKKAFLQAAGFLRILGGSEILDSTSVHPESYEATINLLKKLGINKEELKNGGIKGISKKSIDTESLAKELNVGKITLEDILKELEKPALDPRLDMPLPILRSDVLEISDLKEGMILKGTIRNIVDFGAFVDIGVHQDALVHVSKLSKKFIKHPLEVVSVGDVLEFKVLSIDIEKKKVSLTRIMD